MEQLRFDILEKIRLHPQQSGIGSLLELDLYPDVEIKDEGQHLKIQGYLRLNGSYEGDLADEVEISDLERDGSGHEEIAYVIPVEITLPRDRAEMAFVSAEVESFDYQLLSPFELQIEAVLMIDGILPEKEKEEELVTEISDEETPSFAAEPAQLEEENRVSVPEGEHRFAKEIRRSTHLIKEEEKQVAEHANEEEVQRAEKEVQRAEKEVQQDQAEQKIPALKVEESEVLEELDVPPLHTEDEVKGHEWSRWLLKGEEESFAPIKMVIVQKDDSIDSIAAKYDTSTSAIVHLNQFQTDRLVEGQLVKIPLQRKA